MLFTIFIVMQTCFSAITCLYFMQILRTQKATDRGMAAESKRELEKLHALGKTKLTVPLSEKLRPASFAEICGQAEGKKALCAALCGENPQHVILYGPPGVGKTAAARAALFEAAKNPRSPFTKASRFIEMDAATLRYDERGIADPLIGSVHDPIYQGAGAYGPGGIPQPKPGAVTKAHGGILFLDEIGELPPQQLCRLLKVLEDRRVYFESAYYSRDNKEIPRHIHAMFQEGLPADFRLVGATTRAPEELPAALRSRCTEIFFDALSRPEILTIAEHSAEKGGFLADDAATQAVSEFAQNGRDAVNMMQTAKGLAEMEGRARITAADIRWVAESGRYVPLFQKSAQGVRKVGTAMALAVADMGGVAVPIEAVVVPKPGDGGLSVTGAAETEILSFGARQLTRRALAQVAVENALRFLESACAVRAADYQISVHFPGGAMADGPSAGLAILAALYSALFGVPLEDTDAYVGEITPRGMVLPVGGMRQKMRAAASAGIQRIYMPAGQSGTQTDDVPHFVPIPDGAALLAILGEAGPERLPHIPPSA